MTYKVFGGTLSLTQSINHFRSRSASPCAMHDDVDHVVMRLIETHVPLTAAARLASDRFLWLAQVCRTTCQKNSSTILVFQLALLANISKRYSFLLHEAVSQL